MAAMQVSQRYCVKADPCYTCCQAHFCTACLLCQVRAEMNQRGEYPGGCCCGAQASPVPILPNPAVMQPTQFGLPMPVMALAPTKV